ncbi:MAG: acetylornithine deacetylase, partial [Flavobacteriaceae bacterium]
MRIALAFLFCLTTISVYSQSLKKERISQLADEYFVEGITTLKDFLTLPNYGLIADDINKNLAWCESNFQALGFNTEVLISNGVKHLFAERKFKKAKRTILFYLQIDGQPVDPSQWMQESP